MLRKRRDVENWIVDHNGVGGIEAWFGPAVDYPAAAFVRNGLWHHPYVEKHKQEELEQAEPGQEENSKTVKH